MASLNVFFFTEIQWGLWDLGAGNACILSQFTLGKNKKQNILRIWRSLLGIIVSFEKRSLWTVLGFFFMITISLEKSVSWNYEAFSCPGWECPWEKVLSIFRSLVVYNDSFPWKYLFWAFLTVVLGVYNVAGKVSIVSILRSLLRVTKSVGHISILSILGLFL